jgi:hypothetical protein
VTTQGLDDNAQSWYTGANQEGVNSGWDTGLVNTYITNWNKALEDGTAADYYNRDDATGFVTWEHTGTDPKTGEEVTRKFGDVYEDGKLIGNIYDQYDRNTANRMMAEFTLDARTKAEVYSSSDRDERLDREIQSVAESNKTGFEDMLSAQAFQGDVDKREAKLEDEGLFGLGNEVELFLGGGAGGAILGGGAGAAFGGPVGAGVGGTIGFLTGGTAAVLNQDALTEQAARAYEITRLSTETEGRIAGLFTGVHQWSGFGGKLISPLSNLTQGVYDAHQEGDGFNVENLVRSDGDAAFYKTDPQTGEREAPSWVRGLDVAATVGDSLLQFASPAGVAAYTAQMSGVITGEVGELATTGGKTFDYRTGEFDNIFTDDDGNFDPLSAAAGIGKVGIDVVQLGMVRGLAGGVASRQAYVTGEAAKAGPIASRLPLWMGGSRGLQAGQERVRAGGFSFTRNIADDTIVEGSKRATLGLLAPSEALGAMSARVLAQRTAGVKAGALTADDFYRAAQSMVSGERKIANAMVNAMGEGWEEGIQAVLEPVSHHAGIDWSEVGNNALYGFAAGLGMGMGFNARTPNADVRMMADANLARFMRGLPAITEGEWAGLTATEKRSQAQMSQAEKSTMRAAYQAFAENQANEATAGVAGTAKLLDAIQSEKDRALAKANPAMNGAYVITQIESAGRVDDNGVLLPDAMPADAVAASGRQVAKLLADHQRGAATRIGQIERDLRDIDARLGDASEEDAAELGTRRAELEKALRTTELELQWGQRLDGVLDRQMARVFDPNLDDDARVLAVNQTNQVLRQAFNRQVDIFTDPATGEVHTLSAEDKMALARAVSLRFIRDPQDQTGSFQLLVPQVSAKLTADNADAVLEISHAILPALRGDYDGDKIRQQNELILTDEEFTALRAGQGFVGAGASVNMGAPKWEAANVEALAGALVSNDQTLSNYAEGTLVAIGDAVRGHYANTIPASVLDGVLTEFYAEMRAGNPKARAALIDGLAANAGGAISEFATENLSNEWIWLDQLIVSRLQQFQEAYAKYRPSLGIDPTTGDATPIRRAPAEEVRERHVEAAATLGASMSNYLEGDTLFRMSQKLHYSTPNSQATSAVESWNEQNRGEIAQLALLYKELGQGVTGTDIENARAKDAITGRAWAALQRLADQMGQPVSVVANLQVLEVMESGDLTVNAQGGWQRHDDLYSTGKLVSVAQMLLRRSVQQDMRDKDSILSASPELQAKYARLLGMTRPGSKKKRTQMNAQKAFVELAGAQQMFTLLGEDADIFGPHLTVEQFVRYLQGMSESRRYQWRQKLRDHAAYLGREGKKDMPYSIDEYVTGAISEFQSVVDSVLAVAAGRVTLDPVTGETTGEYADRSRQASEDFTDAHRQIQETLRRFAPRQSGETTAEQVQRLMEANPESARALMALIPNSAANVVFQVREGEVFVSNWVYDMLAEPNAERAEMIYYRNVLMAEWQALGARSNANDEDSPSRRYDRLPRRMHRVMYRLMPTVQKDGGLQFERFFTELNKDGQTVEQFMRWVNTTPGVRGDETALLAWVDDVAEFDMDKAQGGWTQNLQGAERREALSALRRTSHNMLTDLAEEQAAENADIRTLAAIERVLDYDSGKSTTPPSKSDRDLHDRAAKALELAGETGIGIGPTAMLEQTLGAVRAFNGHSHTKGQNPENVNPDGALDAIRDAYDYSTNFERQLAALTSVNIDAVGNSMGELARDGVRTMDDHGRPVETMKPTVADLVRLMKDEETRPLARAMIFPQVMEKGLDGQIRPRLLVGKSLTSLLNRTSFKELYPKSDKLSLDAALRYLGMVETMARNEGGHFSVQRLANDLAIARTSAADHTLTAKEQHDLVVGAYYEIAQVLQASAGIASENFDPDNDPLESLLTEIRQAQRMARAGRVLGVAAADRKWAEGSIEELVNARAQEAELEIEQLLAALPQADSAEQAVIRERVSRVQARQAALRQRVDLLMSDDMAGQVVDMFSVDPKVGPSADKRKAITEYVLGHGNMMSRSTSTKLIQQKLRNKVLDGTYDSTIDPLTPKEWDALSRAVIAVYLDDVVSSGGVSVSPFPDADHSQDYRYYDTSFSYLVEPLLDRQGPLVKAAVKLHRYAGRQGAATDDKLVNLIDRTIFAEYSYGDWTSDIPLASIEANQRIDSASAAAAIAMAGNSPKRQAVISAATRRTYRVPGEELLSRTTVALATLTGSPFDDVVVTGPDGQPIPTVLAQLHNRFGRSVTARFTDNQGQQQEIDLLLEIPDTGRRFLYNQQAADSGYVELSPTRIGLALDQLATRYDIDPARVLVDIEFFHPASQPATPEWANNLFFEGTSFSLDADNYDSLNATLWFANESISPKAQAQALDASKLGKPALQVIKTSTAARREELEQGWQTDLTAVLMRKTQEMFEVDLGDGGLDIEFFNAVFKNMKLRHFVKMMGPDGQPMLHTAEQAIELQKTQPDMFAEAELWIPSDDVLRQLLGEQGTQGVQRVFDTDLNIDLHRVRPWTGSEAQLAAVQAQFAGTTPGAVAELEETRLVSRARQQLLVVRAQLDDRTRQQFDTRLQYFDRLREDIQLDRAVMRQRDKGGFSVSRNFAAAIEAGQRFLQAENIAFDWSTVAPFIGPRDRDGIIAGKLLLKDLEAALESSNEYRTGWVYAEGGKSEPPTGRLSKASLSAKDRKGMVVAPDDLVVVQLDSFEGDLALAKSRIDYFTNRGAIVVLGSSDGSADLRAEVAEYLDASNYERIAGSGWVFQPQTKSPRYQNQRARASTLTEVRGVSPRNHVAVFNVTDGIPIQENAGWIRPGNERLVSIAEQHNLVPVNAYVDFNVPATPGQIEATRTQLRGLDTAEGRQFLKDMAGAHLKPEEREAADASFDEAWGRLMQRFDAHDGTVLPQPRDEFGLGDIIPLVNTRGQLLLYRHGMKAPQGRWHVNQMLDLAEPESDYARNVAVYQSEREPAATIHRGEVVRFEASNQYGLRVELNVPLSEYGDKVQLEWNGMKFILAPMGENIRLPEHGMWPGWGLDIVVDAPSVLSKEATDGWVDNHRNAFAYFGIDFSGDLAEFFFPGQGHTETAKRDSLLLLERLNLQADRISVRDAQEILDSDSLLPAFQDQLVALSVGQENLVPSNWLNRLGDGTESARIARAMIAYLLTPGARVQDVLRSGGFTDTTTELDAQSLLMPRLFTQYFDNLPLTDPLRLELNARFNAQLKNPVPGEGYVLHPDFTFETKMADRSKSLRGFLQFAEAHSSGDNPVKNAMAAEGASRQTVSPHSAAIAYQATGAQTAFAATMTQAQEFAKGTGVTRLSTEATETGRAGVINPAAWDSLTRIPESDKSAANLWKNLTPGELARIDLASEAVVQFRQELRKTEQYGWTEEVQREYADLQRQIVLALGLKPKQKNLVDFWIRQMFGMPDGLSEDGQPVGNVSGKAAVEGARDILANVEDGYLPVVGAEVPLLHVHDLQAIYRANRSRSETQRWSPRESLAGKDRVATSWQDWVEVSLGSAMTSDNLFDPLYLLALDGHLHTYQRATTDLLDLPVSMDGKVTEMLMDEATGRLMSSLDPNVNLLAVDPVIIDTATATLDELLGGRRVNGKLVARSAPASEITKRRSDRRKWRAENGVPVPVPQSLKDLKRNGARFVDRSTKTNTLMRMLINLRVGTALLNPALYVSMGPEQWVRGSLDRISNILVGQSTTGMTAMGQSVIDAKRRAWADKVKAGDGFMSALYGQILEAPEAIGLTTRYTPDQLKKLNQLYETMGQRSDFRALVYKELMYLRPYEPGTGKIEKWLEGYARFGSKVQDPTWGMKGNTLARRYIEAALQHILATPTQNNITVDKLVAEMAVDPGFLQKNLPDAHTAASAAIAQIRSLKPTPISLALRGIYEPLSEHQNAAVNVFGNLVLKMPLLFSGYAVNVATTITGLQGASDFLAMWLHGKENWVKNPATFRGRIAAKLRGEEFDASQVTHHLDMHEVIEGIDLTRSFIRSGVTHTGLFVAGMMAGGLGLSGEDDEARKRRLMAQQQGLGVVYDPRDIRNDFRNAEAMYLDWLPYGTEASGMLNMYAPHWMLKQFVSPMMGMERFFQTGDFRQVMWGFEDALGSFPLINQLSWSDAVATAEALSQNASQEAQKGGDTELITSMGFLASGVAVYERMLFENAFVNALYVGMDRYDRDPYALPLRDSDGELQLDIEGQARKQDIALEQYLDPISGLPKEGYMSRSNLDAQLHVLTENRATLATAMSLFSGLGPGEADWFRYSMPIKTREQEKPVVSRTEAERTIQNLFFAAGGADVFTQQEAEAIIKAQYMARGEWYEPAEVELEAKALIQQTKAAGVSAGLSTIDAEGREHLTLDGAKAVLRGLMKTPLTEDDESLQGIYITYDMRNEILADWSKDLMQEGISLGLTNTQAWYRMKRVLNGPSEDPSVKGLADYLFSDKISYDDTRTYNQLNTTYVIGPDGKPWATGFTRDGFFGALGLKPLQRQIVPEQSGLSLDSRGNVVDYINDANTGLRAVELVDESRNVPTDKEIAEALAKAIEEALKGDYAPSDATKTTSSGGSGWKNWGGYGGYGGFGYGGGGGYGGYANFSKMYALPDGIVPYGNQIQFINTSNPILRRADIRRERVWSERGRLKQWQ